MNSIENGNTVHTLMTKAFNDLVIHTLRNFPNTSVLQDGTLDQDDELIITMPGSRLSINLMALDLDDRVFEMAQDTSYTSVVVVRSYIQGVDEVRVLCMDPSEFELNSHSLGILGSTTKFVIAPKTIRKMIKNHMTALFENN